ncbi:hypothetical protein LTS18_003611, partial [Coniosporium uncinatum]
MPPHVSSRKRHRSPTPPAEAPAPKRAATSTTKKQQASAPTAATKTATKAKHAEPTPTAKSKPVAKPAARPVASSTLFDALDAPAPPKDRKALLESLNASSEDEDANEDEDAESELSSADTDEFEDVEGINNAAQTQSDDGSDGEDAIQWEDALSAATKPSASDNIADLSITLSKDRNRGGLTFEGARQQGMGKKGPSKIERQIRNATHCVHVQSLLVHNLHRNAWVQDAEVQSILVGGLGEGLRSEVSRYRRAMGWESEDFAKSGKKGGRGKGKPTQTQTQAQKNKEKRERIRDWGADAERTAKPGQVDMSRGDPLVRLLRYLAAYWKKRFRITAPGLRKQGYRNLRDLEEEVKSFQERSDVERHGERIASREEFREAARKCHGSRDVGAQLFTALLRGLGVKARMVASLQPVGFGWSKAEEATPRKKGDGERKVEVDPGSEDEEEATLINKAPIKKPKSNSLKREKPSRNFTHGTNGQPINLDHSDSSELSEPESI